MRSVLEGIEAEHVQLKHGRFLRALLAAVLIVAAGCDSPEKVPERSSKEYAHVVSVFYVGLAALEVGDDVRAQDKLAELTRLAPGEPAGWANWGVLALRQRVFDAAAQRLEKARDLVPKNAHIYNLLGVLERERGRQPQAIEYFRKALAFDPQDLRTAYALAQEVERQGDANSDTEFQQAMQKILSVQPDNLAALLELSRVAAKRGDVAALQPAVAKLAARSAAWPPEAKEQLEALQAAVAASDLRAAARRTTFLRNVLNRVPEFRQSFAALKASPGEDAAPFDHFLRMESPVFKTAQADTAITFDAKPLANAGDPPWSWIGAIQMGSAEPPVIAQANGDSVRLDSGRDAAVSGGAGKAPPRRTAFYRSTSTMISRRTWCLPVRAAFACIARIARAPLPT